jgi:hypothetical protein
MKKRSVSNRPGIVLAAVLAMAAMAGAEAFGQEPPKAHVSGTFGDYVWVEMGSGAGPWHVTGTWTAQLPGDSGKGDFVASLLGVRSDLWALQTGADPANPALRMPHTHHIGVVDATVTDIPNGVRLTGIAVITSNGNVAGFSGSPIQVDITGGNQLRFSNIKLTFLGGAVEHFGPQAYEGVVALDR